MAATTPSGALAPLPPSPAALHAVHVGRFALEWALATGASWLVSLLLLALPGLSQASRPASFPLPPALQTEPTQTTVVFLLIGLVASLAQWQVLRRYVHRASLWIDASLLGVALGVVGANTLSVDVGRGWDSYLVVTLVPLSATQAVVLTYLARDRWWPLALGWLFVRPILLTTLYGVGGFLAMLSIPDDNQPWHWAITLTLCMGLPFGFLSGLYVSMSLRTTNVIRRPPGPTA